MTRSPEPVRIGDTERPADAVARKPTPAASPTAYVLWLQRAVGNRATGELIATGGARSPLVQRDPNNGDKKKEEEKKPDSPARGGRETEVAVSSDAELNALPEKLGTAPVQPSPGAPPQPPPPAKSKVRVVMYTPFTGHRDKGIEELSERPAPEPGKEHLARIALLKEKVEAALRVLDAHPDGPDTLRLFLAPEWFFTGKEGDKPYTLEQVHEVIAELEAFSEAHPDLVLVPGSIRWARPEPEPAPWPPEKGRKSVFERLFGGGAPPPPQPKQALFNSAVVVQGGEMKFMYHKQHEGTDFGGAPEGTKQVFLNEVEGTWAFAQWASRDPRVSVPKEGAEPSTADPNALRRTGAPANFFTIEGIDFALDICADFGRGTALRAYLDSQKGEGVDVHLVMAAGIGGQLSPPTTVARVGGYTLLAEGGYAKQKPELRSKVGKVKKREGTLEEAARGYGPSSKTVEYEEQEEKRFVDERKDLVIFDDVLVLPPRPPKSPPPPGTA